MAFNDLLHRWYARGTAYQDHLVYGLLVHVGVPQHALHGLHGLPEEVLVHLLELRPRHGAREVDAIEKRVNLDRGGGGGRQCPLGRVALVLQAFHRARVLPHIGAAVLPLELLDAVLEDPVGEVLAAEVRVASRGLHLEDAVLDLQQGDVEGAAAHVIYQHSARALAFRIKSVSQSRCSRLVNNPQHIEPANRSCILCRLALGIVEIRWHRDDSVGDGL
mmetsp:Transcript_117754/g.315724  ORF Transcript_117754/g.315724 Transcript_117754/m.315724 type:complete len:219 (-) Transcript_117754:13-669(-)